MNKKIIVVAVMAAFAAGAVNAAEVFNKNGNKLDFYGKVKGEHDFVTSDKKDNNDATYARIGFRGETQINDSLSGFGQWEYNLKASNAEGQQGEGATRLAFAGLKMGDAGSIDYGRNYGVVYDIGSYADTLTEFGGDSYQKTDNYMTGRSTGLLTYRNVGFFDLVDGLDFAAQYQGANEKSEDHAWDKSNGEGFGTSLQYAFGDSGVTVGGAYSHAKTTDAGDASGKYAQGDNAEAWTAGLKYDANSIYLATTYAQTRNLTPFTAKTAQGEVNVFLDKTENFEATAAYVFDFGLRPDVAYVQSKGHYNGVSADVVKYVELGATYYFNKNFAVDAGYKINLLGDTAKDLGIATGDQAIVGATYQF
jgi:outer membrane pore protein F